MHVQFGSLSNMMDVFRYAPLRMPLYGTGFLALLMLLGSCGLEVGTETYVSERNRASNSASSKLARDASGWFLPGSARQAHSGAGVPASRGAVKAYPAGTGQAIVSMARSQMGIPYRHGGTTPQRGFDCSGLIYWVYQQHGISVPRQARAQADHGFKVHAGALKPGDIVAFRIKGSYHTGIYSGEGRFIHSPRTGTQVREESINTNYWSDKFVGGRRIF